jgi:hypothetical protein
MPVAQLMQIKERKDQYENENYNRIHAFAGDSADGHQFDHCSTDPIGDQRATV